MNRRCLLAARRLIFGTDFSARVNGVTMVMISPETSSRLRRLNLIGVSTLRASGVT